MKINGNTIKPGMVLQVNGGLWVVTKASHVKPGKGGAFAQVEMKNIRDGRKLNERFRSADKVERVRLDQKDQQFLYENDGMLVFMDAETFEQVTIPAAGQFELFVVADLQGRVRREEVRQGQGEVRLLRPVLSAPLESYCRDGFCTTSVRRDE